MQMWLSIQMTGRYFELLHKVDGFLMSIDQEIIVEVRSYFGAMVGVCNHIQHKIQERLIVRFLVSFSLLAHRFNKI